MTPKELFTVGVRLVGLWFVMANFTALMNLDYVGAAPVVAGLILITRADSIAFLCYPKGLRKDDRREKSSREFRDS